MLLGEKSEKEWSLLSPCSSSECLGQLPHEWLQVYAVLFISYMEVKISNATGKDIRVYICGKTFTIHIRKHVEFEKTHSVWSREEFLMILDFQAKHLEESEKFRETSGGCRLFISILHVWLCRRLISNILYQIYSVQMSNHICSTFLYLTWKIVDQAFIIKLLRC